MTKVDYITIICGILSFLSMGAYLQYLSSSYDVFFLIGALGFGICPYYHKKWSKNGNKY